MEEVRGPLAADEKELERQEKMARENKLGTMPVGRLLRNMSLPIIISMFVQALYNVVDSIFVARLGEGALAALGIVFPVQMLMIGVGIGTGVGVASLLSRRLGERDVQAANKAAMNGLFLALLSWAAFALFGLFFTRPFIAMFATGPDGPAIQAMGVDYMLIVTVGSFGVMQTVILERLLQATGRSTLSMAAQLAGAVTNIVLDPIMIFGYFGFPAMGVAGAALATIIGQFVGMFLALFFNIARNKDIRIKFRGFRPSGRSIKHIYQIGLPGIIMQSVGSFMIFFMNSILVPFGTTAVSVFGVYFKLQSFIFMPAFGLNNGMIPIIAYNFGARHRQRITKTIKLALIVQGAILTFGMLLFLAVPGPLLTLFDAQPGMMNMGRDALRIIALGFPFAAGGIIFTGVFQALGQGMYSLVMSIVRQLVFLLPLALLLARVAGLPALWFAFPISEVCSLVCALVLFRISWKNCISPLGNS